MTLEELHQQALQQVAEVRPEPNVQALHMLDEHGKHLYRLRLITLDVINEPCAMADTPEKCLKQFIKAVLRRLQ